MTDPIAILAVVVPISASAAGIFKMKYSAGKYRDLENGMSKLACRITQLEAGKAGQGDFVRLKEESGEHSVRIAKLETNFNNVNDRLDRMGDKLDRMGDKLDEILKEMRSK